MAIESDITKKLQQAEFQFQPTKKLNDIPDEYYPNVITEDGELLNYITGNDIEAADALFEVVERTVAVREYIIQKDLTKKYSITLILLLNQYKKLKKEIRQIVNQHFSLLILKKGIRVIIKGAILSHFLKLVFFYLKANFIFSRQ